MTIWAPNPETKLHVPECDFVAIIKEQYLLCNTGKAKITEGVKIDLPSNQKSNTHSFLP